MFSVDVAIRHLRGWRTVLSFGMLVFLPKIGILPDKARGRRRKMGRGRRCSYLPSLIWAFTLMDVYMNTGIKRYFVLIYLGIQTDFYGILPSLP